MKPTFVRSASIADALSVAERLRKEDRDELLALCACDPRLALPAYVHEGRDVWVGGLTETDRPEIIWGADPIPYVENAGVVWMLTTPVIYDYPVEFTVQMKRHFDLIHDRYEFLTNFTDERNTSHHKLIKWLGFSFIRRVETFGAAGLPFIEFASFKCA